MGYAIDEITEPFTLPRAGGGEVTIDWGAPATVLVWTCNHCPYALAWHDRIQRVIEDYRPRGVVFAQINANDPDRFPVDSMAAMEGRVANGEFASDYLQDAHQSHSKRWGARVTPDVFVVDGEGRLRYHGAPDGDHTDPDQNARYLREALDDVLAGRTPLRQKTPAVGCRIKWIVDDQPDPHE